MHVCVHMSVCVCVFPATCINTQKHVVINKTLFVTIINDDMYTHVHTCTHMYTHVHTCTY